MPPVRPPGNPWAAKLRQFAELSDADLEVLDRLTGETETVEADTDLVREGERVDWVSVVLDGMLCRYHVLENGRRQISAFLVPGDMCDLHGFLLKEMDHSVGALAPSRIARIPRSVMMEVTDRHPTLARAFWWSTLVDEAVLRQWIVNVGRRTAFERTAHLVWELFLRMDVVGRTADFSCRFPLTQQELADTLGMSIVHINRTLQRLRGEGALSIGNGFLTVRDADRLQAIAGFNPSYLHFYERLGLARR
jgi:CRP-like cAMP-binding protein